MENAFTKEAESKMAKSLENFQEEIMHIRTGRASTGLVESLEVEAVVGRERVPRGEVRRSEPRVAHDRTVCRLDVQARMADRRDAHGCPLRDRSPHSP